MVWAYSYNPKLQGESTPARVGRLLREGTHSKIIVMETRRIGRIYTNYNITWRDIT